MWRTLASIVILLLAGCPVEAPMSDYASSHGRYCQLDIPAAWFDSALTDFPVLFTVANLPSEMFDADGSYPARSDGADVRFSTDSAGTVPLNREIVTFSIDNNPANGTAEIWVAPPSCSASVATVIYVWYNDPDASEPAASDASEGSQGVWDSATKLSLRMTQDPSGTAPQMLDSTSNANDLTSGGTMTSGDLVTGKIGSGIDFDGTDDYLYITDNASLAVTDFYASAWVKSTSSATSKGIVSQFGLGSPYAGFGMRMSAGKLGCWVGGSAWTESSGTINDGGWHHVAARLSSTSVALYIDGSPDGSGTQTPNTSTSVNLEVGRAGGASSAIAAVIDDVRLSNSARSAAWAKAEYNTGNSPGDVTVGTPASSGAATGPEPESLFTPAFRRPILAGFYG